MPLLRLQVRYCYGNTDCMLVSPNPIFHSKPVTKCAKFKVFFLKTLTTALLEAKSKYKPITLLYNHV